MTAADAYNRLAIHVRGVWPNTAAEIVPLVTGGTLLTAINGDGTRIGLIFDAQATARLHEATAPREPEP